MFDYDNPTHGECPIVGFRAAQLPSPYLPVPLPPDHAKVGSQILVDLDRVCTERGQHWTQDGPDLSQAH